jgi:hypothetical protein
LQHFLAQPLSQPFSQAFSQQATGFSQAFSQQAMGFSQAFSQQAMGFSQAFSQQAMGFSQAFSQQATGPQPPPQAFLSASLLRSLPSSGWQRSHAGFPQPQAFSHAFSQQAGSGQHALAGAQHSVLQHRLHSKQSFRPANKSRTGLGRQHFFSHPPHAFSQQAGSGQQALAGWQHATFSQAPQPPHFSPFRRPNSSPPNPWAQRATLSRSAPNIILLFIEQPLLYKEPQPLLFPICQRKPEFRLVHHPMAWAGPPMG